jgi:hypothetical protein
VAKQRLQQVKQAVQTADQVEQALCDLKKRLDKSEEGMASGDLYSWSINTLRAFKLAYKVEIPQFSQIDGPKEVNLLAGFPYKQATMTVAGSGSFHEFGRLVADFENQFPQMRVLNLVLEPFFGTMAMDKERISPTPVTADRERLSFRMEIAALVKPGAS